jgi:hypothetical protein
LPWLLAPGKPACTRSTRWAGSNSATAPSTRICSLVHKFGKYSADATGVARCGGRRASASKRPVVRRVDGAETEDFHVEFGGIAETLDHLAAETRDVRWGRVGDRLQKLPCADRSRSLP